MTSANWNVSCIHSGLFLDYCILQISLSSSKAMQQLLLGKSSSVALYFWFLHCTRQKWDAVHNALLMFALWVGQIPFVFQQVKRTLCSVFQLFSWGFVGQNLMIYYPLYCYLLDMCQDRWNNKDPLLPLQILVTAWPCLSTDVCSAICSCTNSLALVFHTAN